MTEAMWIERATELAEAANRCLRASTECLREAEQARLEADRSMWHAAHVASHVGIARCEGCPFCDGSPFGSPFAGSRDPGAAPAVSGSPHLRSVG